MNIQCVGIHVPLVMFVLVAIFAQLYFCAEKCGKLNKANRTLAKQ